MEYWPYVVVGATLLGGLCFAVLDIWVHPSDYTDRSTRRKALLFGMLWPGWLLVIIITVFADPMLDRLADKVVDRLGRAELNAEDEE